MNGVSCLNSQIANLTHIHFWLVSNVVKKICKVSCFKRKLGQGG